MTDNLALDIERLRISINKDQDLLDRLTEELQAGHMVMEEMFGHIQRRLAELEDKVRVQELIEGSE